ncbi:hypothetical protein D4764_01G0001900 [Takifugu flavidus]|uniref:Uncharacterized protein n=1 Tax=Takifugu flavidus TaxID=433684 RepID=A0A5C6PLN8_9TELE|nr:hypothetical protein D4764_01G0001900 [Takifugu flavidus]
MSRPPREKGKGKSTPSLGQLRYLLRSGFVELLNALGVKGSEEAFVQGTW